ncbi:MAG: thiamine-phosphate kinase [Planctomycetota bacterium]
MREDEVIALAVAAGKGGGMAGGGVVIGPGDDLGGIQVGDRLVLVGVDAVVEGVHYARGTSAERVARKALNRNLSDVAAMGAEPLAAVVGAVVPAGCEEGVAVLEALGAYGAEVGCPVIGGDVSMAGESLVVSVTVVAEAGRLDEGWAVVRRDKGRVGDVLWVTGELGGSMEDLEGFVKHLDFEPRLAAGKSLVGTATAMMDVSDGLAKDLPRLVKACGCGAQVEVDRLPMSEACRVAAGGSGRAEWEHAVGDGEDYELLFACPPGVTPVLPDGLAVTAIGELVAGDGVAFVGRDGGVLETAGMGWEHGRD